MQLIIGKIVSFLMRNEAIEAEDQDVYEYGLYVILTDVMDIVATTIIAILLHIVPQTILYHVAFIPLRRTAGGYHASTPMRCFCLSITTWLLAMWLIGMTAQFTLISVVLAGISCFIVWRFAPVEHENNPLTEDEVVSMRKRSRILTASFAGIVAFSTLIAQIPEWVPSSIAYGMLSLAGSLSFACISKDRKTMAK